MKRIQYILLLFLLTACNDHEMIEGNGESVIGDKILVGVSTSPLDISVSYAPTRTKLIQDAEELPWLIKPLKKGLDITYGKVNDDPEKRNERVAILKLTGGTDNDLVYDKDDVTQWAKYTFKYKDTTEDAIWYDNGEHYFEGMFVPDNLRYGPAAVGDGRGTLASVNSTYAPNITTDQSIENNYSFLEHYLAMPANTRIHATVGRVKLPFYHRLSRVIAYILIDPELTTDQDHPVTLLGYDKNVNRGTESAPVMADNPATTSLRFCNVDVLTGVLDSFDAQKNTHVLTPQWNHFRKVVPHFDGERGSVVQNSIGELVEYDSEQNFYMFYDDNTQEYIMPTMEKWLSYYNKYKNASDSELKAAKVTRTNYGTVPVYDLIVRPTYADENLVMYDERNQDNEPLSVSEKKALVEYKNKIDFELKLSNGLIYTKEFKFDLNANEQTVVYLRISRESVDYNASGSEIWMKKQGYDDWYGLDNQLGHSLSKAGSSWQRAYTFGSNVDGSDKVTDGGFYDETTTGEDGIVGQYLTESTWVKKFAQAYEGGPSHGDYFILTAPITIDAKSLPDNFVFTGHLDAQGNTITITGTGVDWSEYKETDDYNNVYPLYSSQDGTQYTMPVLYTLSHTDANYTNDDELYKIGEVWYLKNTLTHYDPIQEVSHEATEEDVAAGKAEKVGDKVIDVEAQPERYEVNGNSVQKQDAIDNYILAEVSVAIMMTSGQTYYFKQSDDSYSVYEKPTALYKKIDHKSGSSLFAGLNGAYNADEGVANVHIEGGIMVPYTDGKTGWRAEVMNLKVVGALFPESVYTRDDSNNRKGYVEATPLTVSGNVQNCYDGTGATKVPNHTPSLFRY